MTRQAPCRRCRASAAIVPITVASVAETLAMMRVWVKASTMRELAKVRPYHSIEQQKNCSPLFPALKLFSTISAIGA